MMSMFSEPFKYDVIMKYKYMLLNDVSEVLCVWVIAMFASVSI